MKILVVGFPRSGTSLTHRIFKDHPEVNEMFFEKWMLKQAKNKKELKRKFKEFNSTCGEKVIWGKRVIGKIGKTDETIIDYCHKWNDWFKDDARIIQIIRHPLDSLNSLVISKKRLPRGPEFATNYQEYLRCASNFMLGINEIDNCLTIKYEDLLSNPHKKISELYKHCDLKTTHKFTEKIRKNRAFNFKKNELLFKYDNRLESIIKSMNEIKGIKY